jgi:hypothetical protein
MKSEVVPQQYRFQEDNINWEGDTVVFHSAVNSPYVVP